MIEPPGQRERPGGQSQALSKTVTTTEDIVPHRGDRPRFNLARVFDRRHASLELDRMLGVHPYPAPPRYVVVWADRDGEVAS
jgi:hypothetical protein